MELICHKIKPANPKGIIVLDSLKARIKKIAEGKDQGTIRYMDFDSSEIHSHLKAS